MNTFRCLNSFPGYLVLTCVLSFPASVSAQHPVWGKMLPVNKWGVNMEVQVSTVGPVVAGYFSDTLKIDDDEFLVSEEYYASSFAVQYDTVGNIKWAYQLKGKGVYVENMVVDHDDNLILEGRFFESLVFNNQEYQVTGDVSDAGKGAFVAKLSASGNPLWVKVFQHSVYGNICLDEDDNIYFAHNEALSGYFIPSGLWLRKYAPNGNVLWENRLLSPAQAEVNLLNIQVKAGEVTGLASVRGQEVLFDSLSYNTGGSTGFLTLRFKPDGDVKWARNAGVSEYSNAWYAELLLADDGGFYLGGGLPNETMFARYDALGNRIWSKSCPFFSASYLCKDGEGNIFMAGNFYKSPVLQGHQLIAPPDSPSVLNAPNVAVVRFNPNGDVLWINQFEPYIFNDVTSIAAGIHNDIYLCGFSQAAKLKMENVEVALDDSGNSNGFLFRIKNSAPQLPVIPELDLGSDRIWCGNETFILTDPEFVSYTWQDGSSNPSFEVTGPGIYYVDVVDAYGNESQDTVYVTACEPRPDFFIPNIITVNADTHNEYFEIQGIDLSLNNGLTIFNRWGQLIFTQQSYQNTWNAPGVSPGVYYYTFFDAATNRKYQGSLTVMR